MHSDQCTYLNSRPLVAPLEYVLHGLAWGTYWAHIWPFLGACILLPCPPRCITVYDNGSSFTPTTSATTVAYHYRTSKHHNNDIWYRAHTYIHHTSTTIHVLLYTSSILLGRLAVLHSLCLLQLYIYIYIDIYTYIYLHLFILYAAISNGKQKTKAQAIFHNLFTVCPSCKGKFVVCSSSLRNKRKLSGAETVCQAPQKQKK